MDAYTSRELLEAEYRTARQSLRELEAGIKKLYPQDTPSILVYGSYARGEYGPESDLDILLLFSHEIQPGEEIRRLNTILAELNLRYQVLISIVPALKTDYQNSSDPFWVNVRREAIPIEVI